MKEKEINSVLVDCIGLAIKTIKLLSSDVDVSTLEGKRKLYVIGSIAFMIDISTSLLGEKLLKTRQILLRTVFEALVKSLLLLLDENFVNIFMYSWAKEHSAANSFILDNPERYRGMANTEDLEKSKELLNEIMQDGRNLSKNNLVMPDMKFLTENLSNYLPKSNFQFYYREIYKPMSNNSSHLSLGVVWSYLNIEDEKISLQNILKKSEDDHFTDITASFLGMLLEQASTNYDLKLEPELRILSGRIDSYVKSTIPNKP